MKTLLLLLLCLLPAPVYADYGFCRLVTVTSSSTEIPASQTNFPVLVGPNTGATLGSNVNSSSGFDIIAVASSCPAGDTPTKYAHDLIAWDNSGKIVTMNVNVGTLTAGMTFYVCYGNAAISSSTADGPNTYNTTGLIAHYNMEDTAAALTVVDNKVGVICGASNNATCNGTNVALTSTKTVTGQVGLGLTYNGTSDATALPRVTYWENTAHASLGGWFKFGDVTSDAKGMVIKTNSPTPDQRFGIDQHCSSCSSLVGLYALAGSPSQSTFASFQGVFTTGTWYHIYVAYDGTQSGNNANTLKTYVNGSLQTVSYNSTITATVANSTDAPNFGVDRTGFWNGSEDQVELWSTTLSANWINSLWYNQRSSSDFYTLGSEINCTATAAPRLPLTQSGK